MRISDWSSDVCSSDLLSDQASRGAVGGGSYHRHRDRTRRLSIGHEQGGARPWRRGRKEHSGKAHRRSEEHTSELQSLMRISYAVFCLKKKKNHKHYKHK